MNLEDLESLLESVRAEPDSPDKAEALARLETQLAAAREAEEADGPMDLEAANFEPGFTDDSSGGSSPGGPPAKGKPFGKPAETGAETEADDEDGGSGKDSGKDSDGGKPFKGNKAPPFGKKN
jgi:hypothetical protein